MALGDYHSHPDRDHARVEVIKLYDQGWNKRSISRVLHISPSTVHLWIARFEAEHFAGLVDHSRAPQAPARKVWLPLMVDVYHLQKRHADDCEAVCQRLQIHHERIVSTQGDSYKNLLETHFNIQRRLFDDQCSLTTTPAEFEQVHQPFIQTYHTTAHQGLLNDQCDPPIPLKVLGQTKGRLYTPNELMRKFSQALFPRTTNLPGCVTLHSYHFYVEQGVPHTQVLLWVSGEQLRAMLDSVVLAEYHCRYD